MSVLKDLKELVDRQLISEQQADAITLYYKTKKTEQPNKLQLILGSLGAVFVGLAIILILAHNWDQFSQFTRVFIGFIPLALAQLFLLIVLLKKQNSTLWKETSGILLFFSFAASVFITSQIYNITDPNGYFYLSWVVLSIPFLYLLSSTALAILCIVVTTFYMFNYGFNKDLSVEVLYYLLILTSIIPYYLSVLKKSPYSNTASWLHWVIAISFFLSMFTLGANAASTMAFTLMALSTLYYNIGNLAFFNDKSAGVNPYRFIGQAGIVIILFVTSYWGYWDNISDDWSKNNLILSYTFLSGCVFAIVALIFYFRNTKFKPIHLLHFELILLPFTLIFIFHTGLSALLVNLLTIILGVVILLRGIREDRFVLINFGLIIISVLILIRFFESNLSFLFRGIAFAVIGLIFFLVNFVLTKHKKKNEL